MRKLKIVSDSSSDLLKLDNADFDFSPMKILTDEREFVDDRNLDINEMATYLENYKGKSRTSCPNPSDWLEAFGDADDIICVTITSALSGSYNSACVAKQIYEAENEGKRVFVLDTLSAGPEISLILKKLEEYLKNGMDYDTVCGRIKAYIKQTGLVFMLKSLNNFANNGRVSPLVARIAGFAGICIVGKASDEGTLEPTHKCRGESRSIETIIKDLSAMGLKNGKVNIAHCQNEEGALKLKDLIAEKFKNAQVEIHKLRGLCSFYAEKGGFLVGFEKM